MSKNTLIPENLTANKVAYYKKYCDTGVAIINTILKNSDKESLRAQKLEIEKCKVLKAEIESQERIQIEEINAKYKLQITAEKEQTKRLKIEKQADILNNLINKAYDAFNKKMELYKVIHDDANAFLNTQIDSLNLEIRNLELQRAQLPLNETGLFNYYGDQIIQLRDSKLEINKIYRSILRDLEEKIDSADKGIGCVSIPMGYLK